MDWNDLKQIKKFTPINHLTFAKHLIKDRPVYDLGNGFLLSYTDRMFRIDGLERNEFGVEGEYALNLYFFQNRSELEMYFKLKEPLHDYERVLGGGFVICDGITIGSTFDSVNKLLRSDQSYQDGETRALRDGLFQFQNSYISWNDFNFFFFEKSKKAMLTGFQFTLPE